MYEYTEFSIKSWYAIIFYQVSFTFHRTPSHIALKHLPLTFLFNLSQAQSAGAVEYTDSIFAEG